MPFAVVTTDAVDRRAAAIAVDADCVAAIAAVAVAATAAGIAPVAAPTKPSINGPEYWREIHQTRLWPG